MVEAALSAPLRPILALRNMVALGFQQIDLVQVGLLAHLHDCDTEVPEHGRSAAVLLARFPVARLVHEGLPFHGADTQAADDDVDVDVPGTVVTVRVGADDGGMTGEVFLAELQAKGLRPLHGQAVLYCVLRVEADDIMVGLHVLPPAVLAVLAIGNQAGHSKRRFAALKGVEQVRIPQLGSALLVQNGQTGVLVVLKGEIAFGGGVVRVFRGHADCSRRLLTLEKIAEVIFTANSAQPDYCLMVAIQFTNRFFSFQPKVRECGHYNLLLSSTRITLCSCAVTKTNFGRLNNYIRFYL